MNFGMGGGRGWRTMGSSTDGCGETERVTNDTFIIVHFRHRIHLMHDNTTPHNNNITSEANEANMSWQDRQSAERKQLLA
jgi:hypothetical protein